MATAYDKMRESYHGVDDDDDVIDHPEVLVDDPPSEKLDGI